MARARTTRTDDPRTTPLSVSFKLSERRKVVRHARATGETLSAFIRVAALERIARIESDAERETAAEAAAA